MSVRIVALSLAALLVSAAGPVGAHHSYAMFDMQKEVKLEGTVKEYQWTNPHVWVQLLAKDANGKQVEWAIEANGPAGMTGTGWTRNTLKAGDKISMVIHPLKTSAAPGGSLVSATINGKTLRSTGGGQRHEQVAATAAHEATQPVVKGPGSLAGVWLMTGYKGSSRKARERIAVTIENKPPPLLPAAAKLLDQRLADADRGYPFANTLTSCLPGGMPLMMIAAAAYPVQILENPGQITMLFEEQNHFRIIHLNGEHPADPDPSYMGHSIGHWEGDALVVDTVGLSERTTIDQVGTPHSKDLHVVERYRRLDRDTFEVVVTLTDPKTFSSPWQTRAVYKSAAPGSDVSEYICENNRNAPDAQGHISFQR